MKIDYSQLGAWIHHNTLLVVILLSFVAILILVFLIIRYKNNRNRLRLAQEYLTAGKEIPPSLLKENSLYARAVKNLFLGIGLVFFLGFLTETWAWASAGLLFIALGVGQMIVFKKSNKDFTNGDSDR
ncbi:MAG: DUF6249 domain-containing protein [Bacteroidales bacterium]|nr:DUF6249 domain-containing protein [Bacteroidales bacterium]MDD3430774.1 DUF6249 domain-containing protein [Bacteroidales bacterium]MDD4361197.1 DUF6249 domain-containing protein [Bacteroidales bacterium]MDD4430762.1 DUF6249 domain-containing protein [Bacteroidales bacterium]